VGFPSLDGRARSLGASAGHRRFLEQFTIRWIVNYLSILNIDAFS
jgi:hypothetical protein